MKDLNVYFIAGKHPHYETQVKNPPSGVKYINWFGGPQLSDFDTMKVYSNNFDLIRKAAIGTFNFFKLPAIYYVIRRCDLIHSNSLLILNNKPWVVEAEHAASFLGLQKERLTDKNITKKVEKILSKDSCRRILPMSEISKKTIEYFYDTSKFKNKIEVLYPSIAPVPQVGSNKKNNRIRLLFVSNSFFDKGGKEVVEAFINLQKKYDVELLLKSGVPRGHPHKDTFEEFKKKYENHPNLTFDTNIYPRNKLLSEIYLKSDIFVYPTFGDMFGGFVLLEAMSAGLPCIGPRQGAVPEVIEDMKTGLLFESVLKDFDISYMLKHSYDHSKQKFPKIVERLEEKISSLIENDALRRTMIKNARAEILSGKFSITNRNKKIKNIYEESLKN